MVVIGYFLFGIIAVLIGLFVYVQIAGFVKDVKKIRKLKKNTSVSGAPENDTSSEPSTRLNEDDN